MINLKKIFLLSTFAVGSCVFALAADVQVEEKNERPHKKRLLGHDCFETPADHPALSREVQDSLQIATIMHQDVLQERDHDAIVRLCQGNPGNIRFLLGIIRNYDRLYGIDKPAGREKLLFIIEKFSPLVLQYKSYILQKELPIAIGFLRSIEPVLLDTVKEGMKVYCSAEGRTEENFKRVTALGGLLSSLKVLLPTTEENLRHLASPNTPEERSLVNLGLVVMASDVLRQEFNEFIGVLKQWEDTKGIDYRDLQRVSDVIRDNVSEASWLSIESIEEHKDGDSSSDDE